MRQHMRLELKYEKMKSKGNKLEAEPDQQPVTEKRRGRPRLIDRPFKTKAGRPRMS